MKIQKYTLKERICALALVLVIMLTWILPNFVMTVQAVDGDEKSVELHFMDNQGPLYSVDCLTLQSDNDSNYLEKQNIPLSPDECFVTLTLKEGVTYKYEVIKTGYSVEDGSFMVDDTTETNVINISLKMDEIQVSDDSLELKVEDEKTITVENKITGLPYKWSSENKDIATVEQDGTITAVNEGNTKVIVDNGVKSKTIDVSVSKIDVTISIDVNLVEVNNAEAVAVIVRGLPDDATGNLIFYVDEVEEGRIQADNTSRSWIYKTTENVSVEKKIKVAYGGDRKYKCNESNSQSVVLKKTQALEFEGNIDANKTKVIRDDAEDKEFELKVTDESKAGRVISYESSNEEVVTVDNEGKVKVLKAGQAEITVTAKESNTYKEAQINYKIIIKKVIKVDALDDWNLYQKVYDGNTEVTLTANLKDEECFFGTSNVKLYFKANTEKEMADNRKKGATINADVPEIKGIYNNVETDLSELGFYIIEDYEGVEIEDRVEISRRPVYIGTNDITVTYGQDLDEVVSKQNNLTYALDKDEKSGIVENDTITFPTAKIKCVKSEEVEYDTYENEIIPDLDNKGKDDGNNYKLYPAEVKTKDCSKYGNLTVIGEKLTLTDIFERVDFAAGGERSGVVQRGQDIYVKGYNNDRLNNDEGTILVAKLKDETYYQEVWVEWEDGSKCNLTGDGYEIIGESRKKEGKIYLVRTGDTSLESEKEDKATFKLYVDSDSPMVGFGDFNERTEVRDDWLSVITFGRYSKSYYTINNVIKKDMPESDASGVIVGDGMASWSYTVVRRSIDKDGKYQEITAKDIKDNIDTYKWNPMDDTTREIPVVTDASGKLDEVADYYVVLVKATDSVGNTSISASNGIVIDVETPGITITDDEGESFLPDKFYNKNINYKVNISDYKIGVDNAQKGIEKTTSGIKSYMIQVTNNGVETFKEEKAVAEDGKVYSIDELHKLIKEFNGIIEVNKNNSNNVNIYVKAIDQAGNVLETSQDLMIDTTEPEIIVSYDNNAAVNDKYFNQKREMTIVYRERNFDENKATFSVTVGDKTKNDVTFDQLSDFGIRYEKIEDTQGDIPKENRDDKREIIYKLIFEFDNDYKIKPFCTDLAGNENKEIDTGNSVAPYEFTIDKISPVLSVKYYIEGSEVELSAEEESRLYTQKAVKAVVSVEEHNFGFKDTFSENPKQMNLVVDAKDDLEDQRVDTKAYANEANEKTKWDRKLDIYTKSFDFTLDANYSFKISYKDLAGNEAVYEPHYFTVDDTKPEGAVTYETNTSKETWWNIFVDLITFNRFSFKSVSVSFDSKDTTAGVARMEYHKAYEPMTKDVVEKLPASDWTAENTFSVEPNEQFVPYLKVTDKAGNVEYFSSEFAVVADNIAAGPEIEITAADPAHGIHKGNVPFHISVTDPTVGNTYAGLAEVYYEVRKDGAVTQSGNYNAEFQPAYKRVKNLEKDETVNAELNNSNDVEIYVKAVDNAGNMSEVTKDLKIDITVPTIQVTYDLNNPLNGKYYKDIRTATVVVTERNFDESAVRFNITNTDGTQPSIGGWSHSADSLVSDHATHTCQVTFAADGDYTFTLNTTDLAGNDSNYTQVDEFTIDRTIPTIQVSYDNNSAETPGYYNANRTATITVNEHNFNAAEVNTQITAALQGSGVGIPSIGGWSSVGDIHTTSVTFSADADYTFDVDYTDLAGNAAADYAQDSFTVDKTKPEIEFFDIENESANNGIVAPGIKYSDVNYTEGGVDITITGVKHKTEEMNGNRTPIANGESIKMNDFEYTKESDDIYTMTAVIRDKAGNETKEEIRFSVNRFGSNYIFSELTEKLLEDIYTNREQELVVTEINVDTLVFNGISYGLDGTKKELTQGKDYNVKQSGGEGSWKEYTYTIKKENFEKEGRYSVTIDSEDKATNKTNNKVKECNIDFVIDKTAPTVVITGIEETSYREDARDMTVNVSDNTAVKSVEVMIDGKSAAVYDQAEIEKAGGKIDYTIESARTPQSIEAVAIDMAKNKTVSEAHEVLVTSNLLVQYVNNTPLVVGSIIVVVLIAGGLIWFFIGKKR